MLISFRYGGFHGIQQALSKGQAGIAVVQKAQPFLSEMDWTSLFLLLMVPGLASIKRLILAGVKSFSCHMPLLYKIATYETRLTACTLTCSWAQFDFLILCLFISNDKESQNRYIVNEFMIVP